MIDISFDFNLISLSVIFDL